MTQKKKLVTFFLILLFASLFLNLLNKKQEKRNNAGITDNNISQQEDEGGMQTELHPLTIESLRRGEYPGSEIVIEQTLDPGVNYNRYIASYKSEGLKIFGLLTIPVSSSQQPKPEKGWPA